MAYFFRVYQGDLMNDFPINLNTEYAVGGTEKDDIILKELALPKNCFSLQAAKEDWSIQSNHKKFSGQADMNGQKIAFGQTYTIDADNHKGFTVFEGGEDYTHTVDANGKERIILGRSSSCDITIQHKQISGEHLELQRKDGGWHFKDLNSRNGVYLNGKKTSTGIVRETDQLDISFCKVKVQNDTIQIYFKGSVVNNIVLQRETKGMEHADDPYPYLYKQSPRLQDEVTVKKFDLQSPPNIGGKPEISWLNVLLMPALTVGVMLAICLLVTGYMTMLYFSVPMTLIGAVMSVARYKSEKKKYYQKDSLRFEKYNEYLAEQVQEIETHLETQRKIMLQDNPSAAECVRIAAETKRTLWDRKLKDNDFMELRIGTGDVKATVDISIPKQMVTLDTDVLAEHPSEIFNRYQTVADCPIMLNLYQHPACGVIGERKKCIQLAKNMIVQATAHHSYEDLRVVILCDYDERKEWEFARWLPHLFDNTRSIRYYADTQLQSEKLLSVMEAIFAERLIDNENASYAQAANNTPYYLFVCASAKIASNKLITKYLSQNNQRLGVGAIFLFDNLRDLPKECHYIVELNQKGNVLYEKEHASEKQSFVMDDIAEQQYEQYARYLAPIRIEKANNETELPKTVTFLQGYQAKKPQLLNLDTRWKQAFPEKSMAVPIGVKKDGQPFYFDIHQKQSGPHGLVAGMTGSGKSEMVQSWILSMAVHFPPEAVSFVLIDFKGTGLLLPFKNLPHLAGTISDLDTNISRNLIALENELTRRKSLLDQYGVTKIADYVQLYRQGKAAEPLPYLFIVIDEFAEFKLRFPDFMPVVNSVLAVGRTLGVHMIMLTQKPGNVVDDKMKANIRFRWCLKVANYADSRDMIQVPDAAKITNPGRAYVQVGENEIFEEVQSYWSGATYNPYQDLNRQRAEKLSVVDIYGNRISYETEKTTGYRSERNEIDVIVDYIDSYTRQNHVPRAKAIWTQKLPDKLYLKEILQLAFDGEQWADTARELRPVVGLLDDPQSQSQYPYYLDFSANGHYAIYGMPGSGKTSLLHTMIMSLALGYTPDTVHMYLMDFGGGSLNLFKNLPHVGGSAIGGQDDEKVEKIVTLLQTEMDRRKKVLANAGMVNIASCTDENGKAFPYIVLCLDNFAPVLELYPRLDSFFQTFVRDGAGCGMYFVVTAGTQNAISYRVQQNIGGAIALKMQDRNDYSAIVGRTNGLEPENIAGRGLVRGMIPLEMQAALPVEGINEVERVANIRTLVDLMNQKWTGTSVNTILELPAQVRAADYASQNVVIGVSVQDNVACELDIHETPYMLYTEQQNSSAVCSFDLIVEQMVKKYSADTVIAYGDIKAEGIESLSVEAFNQAIAEIMPVLQTRKDLSQRKQLPAEMYPYIAIVIKDMPGFFDETTNETMHKLWTILTLSAGLNVAVFVHGRVDDLLKLYHGGESFTTNMVKRAAIVCTGGKLLDYTMVQIDIPYEEKMAEMREYEGYYLLKNKANKIKIVQC